MQRFVLICLLRPTGAIFQADLLSAAFGFRMLVIPHPLHGWPLALPR